MPRRCRSCPMTALTSSRSDDTSNFGEVRLLQRLLRPCAEPCSRPLPSIRAFDLRQADQLLRCSAASPYCWTTSSPGSEATALRTCVVADRLRELDDDCVPPEKSMPSGRPLVTIRPRPARMTISRQGHRVPAPAQEVVVDVVQNAAWSDTQRLRGCLPAARQHELEHRPRDEHRGEHVRERVR